MFEVKKKSQKTTGNLREYWVNVLKETQKNVKPAWLRVSLLTWNSAQILQKVSEGSKPFWVNLGPVLSESGLTYSFAWKPCLALDMKPGETWQLWQIFYFNPESQFVVEPYGAREKKLHTDSLDEGRIYNFTLTLLLMYLQIQFLK